MAEKKTALITGANKGIGFAAATALATLGYKVWIGARSEERGQKAAAELRQKGLDVTFVHLDVTNLSSVKKAAAKISEENPVLDVLVNNAGISNEDNGQSGLLMPSQLPPEKLREIYETNFFGHITVIQTMLPLLQKSVAGRVVNVSSTLGSLSKNADPKWEGRPFNILGYKSTKAALNMATILFANEFSETSIKINSISPGLIATDLGGTPAEENAGKPGYQTPEEGAKIIIKMATLENDGPTGKFFDFDGTEAEW